MKPWYKSKTIWFNVFLTLTGIFTFLQAIPELAKLYGLYFLVSGGICNVILRIWFTDTEIK